MSFHVILAKIQTNERETYEACFDIFHSERSVCSQYFAKLRKGLLSRTQKAIKSYKSFHFSIFHCYFPITEHQILVIFA